MKSNINPFQIEKIRTKFAVKKDYKNLIKTYTRGYPEIPDENTARLWDYKNIDERKLITKNPMEDMRLKYVASLIKKGTFSLFNIGFGSANLEGVFFGKQKKHQSTILWKGIDISSKSVKLAKKKFPQITFEVGDILKIKEKNNSFDYVVSLEVLEHIKPKEIFKALSEIYRIIKPGGYFILSVPLNEGLEEMIAKGQNPNAHVRIYTPDLIKAELEIAKFTIVKEKALFAFHTFYQLKTFIARHFLINKFHSNNIIILAQKP